MLYLRYIKLDLIERIMLLQWDKQIPVDIEKLALLNNLVIKGKSELAPKLVYDNENAVGYGYYDNQQIEPKQQYQKACLLTKHLIARQPSFIDKPSTQNNSNGFNLRAIVLKLLIPKTAVEYYIFKKSITDVSQLAKIFNVEKQDMRERLCFLANNNLA